MATRPFDRSVAVIMMAICRRLVLESVVSKIVKSVVIFGMSGVNGGEKPFGVISPILFPHSLFPLFGEGIALILGGYLLNAANVIVNVVPSPGMLATSIVPPCSSTMALTMARPRPEEPSSRARALSLR